MSETFSFNRIGLLLRAYTLNNYKNWLTTTLALFGIVFFYSSVIKSNQSIDGLYQNYFKGILYIAGIILASKALNGMRQKSQNADFLLTPASAFEKTLTPLFVVSVFFPIYLIIAMTCGSVLIENINSMFLNKSSPIFNILENGAIGFIPKWLTLQAAFFLGSSWFSKNNLIKTVIALCIITFSVVMFTFLCAKIILPELHISTSFHTLTVALKSNSVFLTIGAAILTLTAWLLTWFKVKEMEIHHGI